MNVKFKRTPEQIALIEAFRGPKSDMAVDTFFDMLEPVLGEILELRVKHIMDENVELKRIMKEAEPYLQKCDSPEHNHPVYNIIREYNDVIK